MKSDSVPRIDRRYTIGPTQRSSPTHTHTVYAYIELDGGMQAGRGHGRSEEGWRVGGMKQG